MAEVSIVLSRDLQCVEGSSINESQMYVCNTCFWEDTDFMCTHPEEGTKDFKKHGEVRCWKRKRKGEKRPPNAMNGFTLRGKNES